MKQLPARPRSALALSRTVAIDRNHCQKVFAALAPGLTPSEVVCRVPGIEGLTTFVNAVSKAAGRSQPDPSTLAAVRAFEKLIQTFGGSQHWLTRRLKAGSDDRFASAEELRSEAKAVESRRRLFHDAADVLGLMVDVLPQIALVRPVPDRPDRTEGAVAYGLIGLKWDAQPLPVASYSASLAGASDEFIDEVRRTPITKSLAEFNGLLPEFSTQPLPTLSPRESAGMTVLTIDPQPSDQKVDLTFAQRWGVDKHPRLYDDAVWSQYVGIKRPTRRVIFDVYMHRSLAMSCVPTVGAYRWAPGISSNPLHYWHERLPAEATLELLGPGLAKPESAFWSKHGALTRHLFAALGWDAAEFIGHRCEMAYPLWNSSLYMTFDFRSTDAALGAARP